MKTKLLIVTLTLLGTLAFGQSNVLTDKIIVNSKGKILSQSNDYIKTEYPTKYSLTDMKTICDTTAKVTKVSIDWRLNYDKNYEKEFIIGNKKILVTIYENDKVLYFEFFNK